MEVKVSDVKMRDRLKTLGFKRASEDIEILAKESENIKAAKKKMMLAYEHFRFVTPKKIAAFQEKLMAKTKKGSQWNFTYQKLSFVSPETYRGVPPEEVLVKMEDAMKIGCFDSFKVAFIEEVKVDPILFGVVDGCDDLFYVAQWDNDVKITDILADNEG